MNKKIIYLAVLATLLSASVANAQFSSSAPQGSDSNGGVDGSASSGANGSIGATDGGR